MFSSVQNDLCRFPILQLGFRSQLQGAFPAKISQQQISDQQNLQANAAMKKDQSDSANSFHRRNITMLFAAKFDKVKLKKIPTNFDISHLKHKGTKHAEKHNTHRNL